ncbi:GNAT family N-acetyltransferase [Caulobacter sp. KR2-114]|uniref:GNAT family N-acetyltransferase n=1 Tax=Caulobacter sp. KR2-114 TaxID=3400912 RepID=UPI003C0F5E42
MSDLAVRAAPRLSVERPEDRAEADALIARAFGPGRHAKAAERLREHNAPLEGLCFVAHADGRVVGCVRQWPVLIGDTPAVFLGPIAVDDAFRHHGLGGALVQRASDAAKAAGHRLILLVGDTPLFRRVGFEAEPARRVTMPGPVDQRRVQVKPLAAGAEAGLGGPVTVP